jgi:hypothetical protein
LDKKLSLVHLVLEIHGWVVENAAAAQQLLATFQILKMLRAFFDDLLQA